MAKVIYNLEENEIELARIKTDHDKLLEDLRDKEALVASLKSNLDELEIKEKMLNKQLEVSSQEKLHFEEVKICYN